MNIYQTIPRLKLRRPPTPTRRLPTPPAASQFPRRRVSHRKRLSSISEAIRRFRRIFGVICRVINYSAYSWKWIFYYWRQNDGNWKSYSRNWISRSTSAISTSVRSEIRANVTSFWLPSRKFSLLLLMTHKISFFGSFFVSARQWRRLPVAQLRNLTPNRVLIFIFFSFFRRRIQSQHNLLEKELAEHTIDFLKSSNIRIIEKVGENVRKTGKIDVDRLEITSHNRRAGRRLRAIFVCFDIFSFLSRLTTLERGKLLNAMIKKGNFICACSRMSEKGEKGYFFSFAPSNRLNLSRICIQSR